MLTALGDSDDVGGNEIILELAGTLIEMQERMMALLDVLLNEDVSGQSWGWSGVGCRYGVVLNTQCSYYQVHAMMNPCVPCFG